jgi:hypothetical protein
LGSRSWLRLCSINLCRTDTKTLAESLAARSSPHAVPRQPVRDRRTTHRKVASPEPSISTRRSAEKPGWPSSWPKRTAARDGNARSSRTCASPARRRPARASSTQYAVTTVADQLLPDDRAHLKQEPKRYSSLAATPTANRRATLHQRPYRREPPRTNPTKARARKPLRPGRLRHRTAPGRTDGGPGLIGR